MARQTAAEKAAAKAAGTAAKVDAPAVIGQTPAVPAAEAANYDFAVNVLKLNRARAWVNQNVATLGVLKGADLTDAVRERYVQLGGLLRGEVRAGKVVNLADDDGSKD